ncbi:MAG: hypothetical protein JST54_00030 [Deltaproteobacteria bacterium]|nr:hypothetical protein [Deltaproteobacteria bacterium]
MKVRKAERGSALLVAIGVSAVLLLAVSSLYLYASGQRERASRQTRELARVDCAEAGLQLARAFFANNVASWNTYLADPSHYNPVPSTWNTAPANPTSTALQTTSPYSQLFFDLDGDGKLDVYIYVRDNQDELPPAANNWAHDNDQNVIVGAACISGTLTPRLENGLVDTSKMTAESLLSLNTPGNQYSGQSTGGASNNGNVN